MHFHFPDNVFALDPATAATTGAGSYRCLHFRRFLSTEEGSIVQLPIVHIKLNDVFDWSRTQTKPIKCIFQFQFGREKHHLIKRHARMRDVASPTYLDPPVVRRVVVGLGGIKVSSSIVVLFMRLPDGELFSIETS